MYFAGQATSMFGDGTVAVTYAFAALLVTRSGWAMPAVLLGLWVTRMLLLGAGGRAADRRNRALTMMWADAVRLGAQLFTAVCFLTGEPRLWQLVASAAVFGAATAFFVPASKAIMPQLVPAERLQKANSTLGVVRNAGLIAGPAIAAGLYSVGGVPLALGFDILTFAVSVVCLAAIAGGLPRPEPETTAATTRRDKVPLRGAFAVLARYPVVAWIVAVWCFSQIGVASVNVLGPLIARDELGDVGQWSVLATVMAVGGLAGSAVAGWLRVARPTLLILVLLGTAMPPQLLVMAHWPRLWTLAVLFAWTSVALAMCGVLFDTYLQQNIPDSVLGRVSAAEQGLTSAMIPLSLAICLPLATLVGQAAFLTWTAVSTATLAVVALAVTTRIRRR
ncbi:MFS transporter [Amycolatopsis sp. NPDC051903]|uniref:MFS transporter n=1 Tax=Amycolatopsis sp. NPDC051903 TaxID=3363936 RepID=UPI00379309ED